MTESNIHIQSTPMVLEVDWILKLAASIECDGGFDGASVNNQKW